MNMIFDACALIAYLRDETGAETVETLLLDKSNTGYAHAINLCEVFYDFRRESGESAAQQAIQKLLSIGLITRNTMDNPFWQQAGRCTSELRRVSLADCFCITLAQRLEGFVVTADHHEFDIVAEKNIVPVKFIR